MTRVFTSFAIEDKDLRNLLVGQKKNSHNDIEFTDYSVHDPWDRKWKTNCRARIKSCKGVIGIITTSTPAADGQLWELKCAIEEERPLLLIHGYTERSKRLSVLPSPINGRKVYNWRQSTIVSFLNNL